MKTQSVENPIISLVPNAKSNLCTNVSAAQILADIKNNRWKKEIENIRNTYYESYFNNGDHKDAKRAIAPLKLELAAVMWAGHFSSRNAESLVQHSGLIVMDLDDLPKDALTYAREHLQKDASVWACFLSPSGNGLKVIYKVLPDQGSHRDAWRSAADRINKLTGLIADASGKDLARLCFVSHDPDLYQNPHARELEIDPCKRFLPTPSVALRQNPPVFLSIRQKIAEEIFGPVEWTDDVKGRVHCPGKEHHTNENDEETDCRIHLDGAPNAYCFHESCSEILREYNRKLQSRIGTAEFSAECTPNPDETVDTDWFILPGLDSNSITESARAIFSHIAPTKTLFRRGSQVVELSKGEDGKFCLEIMKPPAFRSRIEQYDKKIGAYRTNKKGERKLQRATCSEEYAKAFLHCSEIKHLPPVSIVLNAPAIIEANGGVKILGQGYHDDYGGILVCAGQTPPLVRPQEAVTSLLTLLEEFDFQTPSDKSRAAAGFLTPALQLGGMLDGHIPVDMAEADASQSGKTYRQKLCAAIYNESPRFITQRNGGVGSLDESFSQALVAGSVFILFENVRGKINSPMLEGFLTAGGMFPARVPHRGEIMVNSKNYFLQMTSNSIEITKDLANRASISRIKKKLEGYKFKRYSGGDLLAHVRANQPYFLGSVFAVVGEWVSRGKQKTNEARHDFTEWAQSLDWIVQNILGLAPLMNGHQQAKQRTSNPTFTWLREIGLALKRQGQLGTELIAGQLANLAVAEGFGIPGLKSLDDEGVNRRRIGTIMNPLFQDASTIEVDKFIVIRAVTKDSDPENRVERELKYYRFVLSAPSALSTNNDSENCPGGVFSELNGAGSAGSTSRKEENHAKIDEREVVYV
ncbi:MAG: BT4734/BF3469 family protein [Planctomycetota bacterium]|jgi:hypothetical protein|nr:BT4734/BF3469 family protein [Planctomycetota bacterium]|tara:strand:+ start:499 stop:3099 length:2601 start_codon:yes stop_codon:yes gene_type:complete